MQNRYAGDVGDFGKLGLLRYIANSGLRIGVNWCLTPDETNNKDGKHVGYLTNPAFCGCDDYLLHKLSDIAGHFPRNVDRLESQNLIPNALYYQASLLPPATPGFIRHQWHEDALKALANTDIVFLDPDNGLLVKSVSPRSAKSNKYITVEELQSYYIAGKSVVFYNHRCRQPEPVYLQRFYALTTLPVFHSANWMGLKFPRGTTRDYIMLIQPDHAKKVKCSIEQLLASPWNRHFSVLPFPPE